MRREERAITDIKEIHEIIHKAEVCRLGLAVENTPYIVPVNYGFLDNSLYVHCATEGRKLDMIRKNNTVCFEIDIDHKIIDGGEVACKWGTLYRSVIGYGKAFIIDDFEEKKKALNAIMNHYSGKKDYQYTDNAVKNVGIIRIDITYLSGKQTL
jgi:nitroimidazol reductase NimA-like FMN-containing flavoprotein (pyridoxamine 5'-phosphate oxidase superfamily)